jgi:hypothetical protein
MDCDIHVTDPKWIGKCVEASKVLPAFMFRMNEPQYRKGGKIKYLGLTLELYDEGIGCINVFRRTALEKVGGYDTQNYHALWGMTDCLFFRQLKAAGYFKAFGQFYPSLANTSCVEEQDKDYDKSLQGLKDIAGSQYAGIFWETQTKMLNGELSYYRDYNLGLE